MALAHYRLEGTTAFLQMDDGKANALSRDMIAELVEALTRAEKEARAVVLYGRPDRFCAGFDLKVMMSSPEAAARVGFLDEVVPAEQVVARATEEVKKLGAMSPMAFRATKKRLRGRTIERIRGSVDEDMEAIARGE